MVKTILSKVFKYRLLLYMAIERNMKSKTEKYNYTHFKQVVIVIVNIVVVVIIVEVNIGADTVRVVVTSAAFVVAV